MRRSRWLQLAQTTQRTVQEQLLRAPTAQELDARGFGCRSVEPGVSTLACAFMRTPVFVSISAMKIHIAETLYAAWCPVFAREKREKSRLVEQAPSNALCV